MKSLIAFLSLCLLTCTAFSTVIHVPANYPTIQAGIDAAGNGDTVMVAPGVYVENIQITGGVHADPITLIGAGWENTTIDGGGIYNTLYAYEIETITIEGFTVRNAQQSGSAPGNVGIHLNPVSSAGTKIVRNCRVTHNGHGIQIWNDFGGLTYIEHNVIDDNLYDGFYPYLGTVYLTNNTIVNNNRDGYHDWSGGGAIYIKNNIIAYNGRYGIYKHLTTPVFISYNDVYENAQGAYMEGYSGPAQPFTPNPGTGEIAQDPLFFGSPFDYYITWENFPIVDPTMSPCIDAGDPTLPQDPDGTTADMGCFCFDQTDHDVDLMLIPFSPPIIIPAGGGSFDFTLTLRNLEYNEVNADIWIMVTLPDGSLYGPVLGPVNRTLGAAAFIERTAMQNVPGTAPGGVYRYEAYVGVYPTTIWSSGDFEFTKSGTQDGSLLGDWTVDDGEFTTPDGDLAASLPQTAQLLSAYPNPFNPATTIHYTLSEASRISLKVFDVSGREVVALADGWRSAGAHDLTFQAEGLTSGVYVIRLQTSTSTSSCKILLTK